MPAVYVMGKPVRTALCSACKAEMDRAAAGLRARETELKKEAVLAARQASWCKICPPLYRDTDRDRLPPAPLARVLAWRPGPRGLLLLGPTGAGKTRAAYLLLRDLWEKGLDIRAFDCAAFAHEVGRRFRDGTGEDWTDSLATAALVFLDDVGKSVFTERAEAELFALVERRAANVLPTLATTNLPSAELSQRLSADRSEPLIRRLREFSDVVTFPQEAGK